MNFALLFYTYILSKVLRNDRPYKTWIATLGYSILCMKNKRKRRNLLDELYRFVSPGVSMGKFRSFQELK